MLSSTLSKWVRGAEAFRQAEHFSLSESLSQDLQIQNRIADYYTSLVGELFVQLREDVVCRSEDWARLGNAFAYLASNECRELILREGISQSEVLLYSSASFYLGGFSASAYLIANKTNFEAQHEFAEVCFEFLARPANPKSETTKMIFSSLISGDSSVVYSMLLDAKQKAKSGLEGNPEDFVYGRIFERLLLRFSSTNIRAVLPDGDSIFWKPLIENLLFRKVPCWDFFPSQIEAINRGLLSESKAFALQMPTSSGKTALCETLLFSHLKRDSDSVAIILVPYRSLAAELRSTLVKNLKKLGLNTRCSYGGTVASGNEIQALEKTRALVATPESLSGILSADPSFFARISLVVCDEGHLLDSKGRGVGLELLLSRLKDRVAGAPRFVYISAIIPNINDINLWLGGSSETVVKSSYKPSLAEYGLLRRSGTGQKQVVALEMHPHEARNDIYRIENYLTMSDFAYNVETTERKRHYPFKSFKVLAVASARKALAMGAVVIFAPHKGGNQGVIGLAEELIKQVQLELTLPKPIDYSDPYSVLKIFEYLKLEYGADWVGTKLVGVGACLHHGDIPQETREVLEGALREGLVKLAICTSTLAEGVNLPIRTLVLYSVKRSSADSHSEPMSLRDIKNLVGRVGRAGVDTKGLVICVNESQWSIVEPVARLGAGEPVRGALRALMEQLKLKLAVESVLLTNENMESWPELFSLIDGVDSTLIDLIATEIGDDTFLEIAKKLAEQTYAYEQATEVSKGLLQQLFGLRASRIISIRDARKLESIRETGARPRLLESVENLLLPTLLNADTWAETPAEDFVDKVLTWAWGFPDFQESVRDGFRLDAADDSASVQYQFYKIVKIWLGGFPFNQIAAIVNIDMDRLLRIQARVIGFSLVSIVEQGFSLGLRLLAEQGVFVNESIAEFPEFLRYGVPTVASYKLSMAGVRHRSAAVSIGTHAKALRHDTAAIIGEARRTMVTDAEYWKQKLGVLVFEHTLADLSIDANLLRTS